MRTLAIECATEACSVALFEGDALVASEHRILGRGHAEHLVPMIAALPDKGRAERILVSLGPGSFTGVRIGIAVATSLAIAWRSAVLGYPTLSLVAAIALVGQANGEVTVCMAGGHGEWFVQDCGPRGTARGSIASLSPEAAQRRGAASLVAGTRAEDLASLLDGEREAVSILPDARKFPLLDPSLFTEAVAPIYGRGPDARLPA